MTARTTTSTPCPSCLNGEAYNLQVAYEFDTEEWSILGATQGLDPSGMASKERRLLKEGDVVTTIWKLATLSGDDEFEMYAADEVTVTADTAVRRGTAVRRHLFHGH